MSNDADTLLRRGGSRGQARHCSGCFRLADDGLTATVAVGLTFFSDARRGCAFLAAFF